MNQNFATNLSAVLLSLGAAAGEPDLTHVLSPADAEALLSGPVQPALFLDSGTLESTNGTRLTSLYGFRGNPFVAGTISSVTEATAALAKEKEVAAKILAQV